MRLFRPPQFGKNDQWAEIEQVVLPKPLRTSVIGVAHDGLSGHLGIKKTYSKILNHFFWPGVKKDVQNFVKTCDTCQVVGNPNQHPPKAPLCPIPVMSEPFDKILIDCVGPLPKTKRGNEYLLTVLCTSTRYPEAFPLKRITTKNIVTCLQDLFTTKGIPKVIQSDQGSNFTSDLFQQVAQELHIKHVMSTAYHPQSQGSLERFHSTFKTMLRKYGHDYDSDWDTNINWLLFAIRECPQESLGFSPFELLYGRQVRGPLQLIKEEWTNSSSNPKTVSVKAYIDNLREKLKVVRDLASSNLLKAQGKMKVLYDRKSVKPTFADGDEVLVYLPIPGQPLKSKYAGPYPIVKKLSDLTYLISTPDRRKKQQKFHVNLLKLYHRRKPNVYVPTVLLNSTNIQSEPNVNDEESTEDPKSKRNPPNSEIILNLESFLSHLNHEEQCDIHNLLLQHQEVVSDSLGRCKVLAHDIKLTSPSVPPIRQPAFRMSPNQKIQVQTEVEYLLNNDLIQPSSSPWASPCLLVPKPDGSKRFCTDYRKVNEVTVPDSYPLPLIEDLIDQVGNAKVITTIDLLKGYYQIPLTPRAREISAFITSSGLYEYKVMPFGLRNAPATFQRIINIVIRGLPGVYAYLDDIIVIADSWQEHLQRIQTLFTHLVEAGLTINLAKTKFGNATVSYLGHVIGQGQTRPKLANVEAILKYPPPTNRKELLRFLGMVGYYRKYCLNFSDIAAPLADLSSPKRKYLWTDKCQTAFEMLKSMLMSDPVLITPDFSRPFELQVDASLRGVGAVLLQRNPQIGVLHPISYYSRKLKTYQENYTTIELEALALILALQRFKCYLQDHSQPIIVHTDHNPLVFLNNMKHHNRRISRWALEVQEYPLVIKHIKGTENVLADALSRMPP